MRVLKITLEGITTSFRYPHFMQGIHPTFEMPPPATIYGHVCSAVGEWVAPEGLLFAYRFTHAGKFDDVEHVHVLSTSGGKLPGTTLPKVLDGAINPFKRQMLFRPRLTLYLNKPEWEDFFRSPRYPVVLGRSQDLCSYTQVDVIELSRSDEAYFEHTLAPYHANLHTAAGYVATMPRYLDYAQNRRPSFARYVVLNRRVTQLMRFEGLAIPEFWIDPSAPVTNGKPLGLWFHSFVGAYDDTPRFAP
jgi:CRISPR-associated protein Cas5t